MYGKESPETCLTIEESVNVINGKRIDLIISEDKIGCSCHKINTNSTKAKLFAM